MHQLRKSLRVLVRVMARDNPTRRAAVHRPSSVKRMREQMNSFNGPPAAQTDEESTDSAYKCGGSANSGQAPASQPRGAGPLGGPEKREPATYQES